MTNARYKHGIRKDSCISGKRIGITFRKFPT